MKTWVKENGYKCYSYKGDIYWSKSKLNYPFEEAT